MIKSTTCTATNTLRARSVKSVGCASDSVKTSRDVSTSAKCSWKCRDASLRTLNVLFTHHTLSLSSQRPSSGSTYTGSPSNMGVFMKATQISKNLIGEVLHWSHCQQNFGDFESTRGAVASCAQGCCELSHHETRSDLLGSLRPVTPTCGTDFASHLNSWNCLTHGKTYHQSSSRFTASTTSSVGKSSSVSSSTLEEFLMIESNSALLISACS